MSKYVIKCNEYEIRTVVLVSFSIYYILLHNANWLILLQYPWIFDLRRGHVSYFSCHSHSLSLSHSAFAMFVL